MQPLRPLYSLSYVIARGVRGMAQAPIVQLLAISTMAVCMLLLGLVILVFTNTQSMVTTWGLDVPITVYWVDDADPTQVDAAVDHVRAQAEVARAHRVSPEQALQRLNEGLGEQGAALEGLDPSIMPASLEIDLVPGTDPAFSGVLAEQLSVFPVVAEVAAMGSWASQAHHLLRTIEALAWGVGLLVSLACITIVWSTIRLGVYARRAEIQILGLVGGTPRFVHGSFVFEGIVQGALGAALALGMLWMGFDAVHPFVEYGLRLVFAAGALQFFSPVELVIGVIVGAGLGLVGARAAVAQYAEV